MLNKSAVKYVTLVSSIIAFIIGLVISFYPVSSDIFINYILVLALGVLGISKICEFASMSERSAWDLVLGILYLMCCMVLLANDTLFVQVSAGYVFGFLALIAGIRQFFIAPAASKLFGDSKAWYIITGILAILIAITLFAYPIATQAIAVWLLGVFLIAGGLVGFIQGLCISTKKKK